MNIALAYNVRHVKPDINNPQYIKEAEFDEPSTIEGITKAIESLGHKVVLVEADENAYEKFKSLKNDIDLVFNFAEGLHGADREAQIPAMLEMLGIPYTGPKPFGYAVGLNKAAAKELLAFNAIPTAQWATADSVADLKNKQINFYPAIVKPIAEGSSKGIRAKNLVKNREELESVVGELVAEFKQPVLIEEFLPGREFTVAILGTPPEVLPVIEITFDELPEGMPKFDHYESKWIYDNPGKKADPLVCPAKLPKELTTQIEEMCLNSFRVLQMSDWARFDLRLDNKGVPNVIEVNCPPGIIPDPKENSRFPRAARAAGYDFSRMIEKILQSACERYGIIYH